MRRLILSVTGLVAVAALAGVLFQRRGLRADRKRFPPAGQLLSTPFGRFHVVESGRGGTPVLLEAGLAGSSLSWAPVQEQISGFTRSYSYDRLGFGWSDPGRSARTVSSLVNEFRSLLDSIGLSEPCILVGHSFGGLLVRVFAHRFPERVCGLVLVDPISTSYWATCAPRERQRLQRGIRLARRGALLADLGVVRFALHLLLLGRSLFSRVLARASAPGAVTFLQRLTGEIQNLPESLWPVVRAQWSRSVGFYTICEHLAALEQNCISAEAERMAIPVPTVILSASTATRAERQEREDWLRSAPAGRCIDVPNSGHWIQVERPDVVSDAICEVLAARKERVAAVPAHSNYNE